MIKSIINTAVLAGAKVVEPKSKKEEVIVNNDVLEAYRKMFGERKNNKYTENEIFIFNSKLNASQAFAKYI
ncbi:MAG: hypothetical protein LBR18_09280 [Tannerella sp.]|nr:hypothetical protein [Tannerella sp.]